MKKQTAFSHIFYIFDVETESFDIFNYDTIDNIGFKFAVINTYQYNPTTKESKRIDSKLCLSQHELYEQLILISCKHLMKYNEPACIYAHNIDFDILFIYQDILQSTYKRKQLKNHVLIQLSLYNADNKCFVQLRNSLATFAMLSVEKLGKAIKMKKLEQNYRENTNDQFIAYCQRDCDIVAIALTQLMNLYNHYFGFEKYPTVTVMPVTVGGAMLQLFLCHAQNNWFDVTDYQNKDFRAFYFGGRTEAFDFAIHDSVECYDFNSFYASMMISHKFPLPPYVKYAFQDIADLNDENVCLICCDIDDIHQIPLLVEKIDGFSMNRSCRKCSRLLQKEEFDFFMEQHQIVKIHYFYKCSAMINPFEYLNIIYNDRIQMRLNDNDLEYLLKIMANNAYGRFGMRTDRETTELYIIGEIVEKYKSFDEFFKHCEQLGHKIQTNRDNFTFSVYKTQHIYEKHINVLIAMRIAALTRLAITMLMRKMRSVGIDVIYCDTDSVFFDSKYKTVFEKEFASMIDEYKIGYLKHEKTCKQFYCMTSKAYEYIDENNKVKVKLKGVKNAKNLKQYYESEIEQIHICKINESIRRNFQFGTKVKLNKSNNEYYKKRLIQSDMSTKPITNESIEDVMEQNKKVLEGYHEIRHIDNSKLSHKKTQRFE